MDREKILEEFKKILGEVMENESNVDLLEKCKSSLGKLTDLNDKLVAKVSELESERDELSGSVETLEASVTEKSEEAEALIKKVEEIESAMSALEEEKTKLSGKLEEIAKKEQSKLRLEGLEKEGLLFSEGSLREKQETVAYDASDEEFAAYTENLKEMKTAFAPVAPVASAEAEEDNQAVAPDGDSGEEEVAEEVTPPADIDKGRESASAVIPNVNSSGKDDKSEAVELGEALAEYCASRRK